MTTADRINYLYGCTDHKGLRHSIFVQNKKTIYRVRSPRGDIVSENEIAPEQINGIKNRVGGEKPRDDEKRFDDGRGFSKGSEVRS